MDSFESAYVSNLKLSFFEQINFVRIKDLFGLLYLSDFLLPC